MRILKKRTLQDFWDVHTDCKDALLAWHNEFKNSSFEIPNDIIARYPTADILPDNRVVFNIKGNNYRLIVKINYKAGMVFIRFIGTHSAYDKIDAETV